jgi:alcohol dehydrogenase (cytochrome c)
MQRNNLQFVRGCARASVTAALAVAMQFAYVATSAAHALPGPWPTYNNGYDGQRFSPAKQITPANVATLKRTCEAHLGDVGSFQSGPLVIGSSIYVTTSHTTVALDATTCAIRWRHVHKPVQDEVYAANRGVAYLDGRLFRGTGDGRIFALDAKTGKQLWQIKGGDPLVGKKYHANF